jgi:hypothetical protein
MQKTYGLNLNGKINITDFRALLTFGDPRFNPVFINL